MKAICFNSHGETIEELFSESPALKIVWAKAFKEVYCHHASLTFPYVPAELFPSDYFKISVGVRQQTIDKGKVKNFNDKIISSHMPGIYEDGIVTVPLNSVQILDCLCENGWTSLKNGKRGATKSFPLSITVHNDNKKHLEFLFHHLESKFPFTICENEFNKLNNDEKLETVIELR